MIADLGLSKKLGEINTNSILLGMPAYIEPQCYIKNNYKRSEKSDIYSLGVLLWEISSGKPPFSGIPQSNINLYIVKGIREQPIENTSPKYQLLYKNCWKEEPNQKPDIDEVHRSLIDLKLQFDNNDEQTEVKPRNDLNSDNSALVRNSYSDYGDSIEKLDLPSNGKLEFYYLFLIFNIYIIVIN
jgi:serine/threonine protein kinase